LPGLYGFGYIISPIPGFTGVTMAVDVTTIAVCVAVCDGVFVNVFSGCAVSAVVSDGVCVFVTVFSGVLISVAVFTGVLV
jgi:hypothetical protein